MSKCVCFCACVCVHVSECVLNQTERLNMNVQFLISIDMRRNGFKRERFYRDENLHIFRFCYLITTATDLFVFFLCIQLAISIFACMEQRLYGRNHFHNAVFNMSGSL